MEGREKRSKFHKNEARIFAGYIYRVYNIYMPGTVKCSPRKKEIRKEESLDENGKKRKRVINGSKCW